MSKLNFASAARSLAYEEIGRIQENIEEGNGGFNIYDLKRLNICLIVVVGRKKIYPALFKQIEHIILKVCKPDHECVDDEDRTAHALMLRKVVAIRNRFQSVL